MLLIFFKWKGQPNNEEIFSKKKWILVFMELLIQTLFIISTLLYSLTIEQFLMQPYPGCTRSSILMHPLLISIAFSAGGMQFVMPPMQEGVQLSMPQNQEGVQFSMPPKSEVVQFSMPPKSEMVQFSLPPKSEGVQFSMPPKSKGVQFLMPTI